MLIPDDNPKDSMLKPKEHVMKARQLDHPFQLPPNLPLDLQYAASASIPNTEGVRKERLAKAKRISQLADKSEFLDKQIWNRMPSSVKVTAGKG